MPTIREFKLPDIGEGLTEGEIIKWMVSVGDTVVLNQPIVEVETAKVTVELPSPYAGVVTTLHYPEGATVEVGAAIIAIDTDPGGTAPASLPESEDAMLVGPGPKAAATKRRTRRPKPASVVEAVRATKTAVHSAFGPPPSVSGMPPIVQPHLDQAPPPAPRVSSEPPPIDAAVDQRVPSPAPHVSSEPAPIDAAVDQTSRSAPSVDGVAAERARAKPPVRKYAKDAGVDLAACTPTGPDNTVSRADVDRYLAGTTAGATMATPPAAAAAQTAAAARREPPVAKPAADREERIPIKGIRKATAQAMVQSAFTAPHVTTWLTVDVTPTTKLLARLMREPAYADTKLSPLAFLAKAAVLCLRKHPVINSTWDEQAQEIVLKHYVNLGVAAATPRGLLVPNIKDAGRLSLRELADAIAGLTTAARSGSATMADLTGGSFTITNVGVFGVDGGTPIINPGEAAILAFGAIRKQPWVHKGKIKARDVTTLALSFDHRIIDGEAGSRFLTDVAAVLADPRSAFLM